MLIKLAPCEPPIHPLKVHKLSIKKAFKSIYFVFFYLSLTKIRHVKFIYSLIQLKITAQNLKRCATCIALENSREFLSPPINLLSANMDKVS